MDLEQQSEPRKVPYPLVFVSLISGAFFLLGVGISAYTLNAIEAAQQTDNDLNIARLAESKQVEFNLTTDVQTYTNPDLGGVVSFEYPSGWTPTVLPKDSVWLKELTKDSQVFRFAVSITTDQTHLQTATSYAEKIAKIDAEPELIETGETASENLIFGLYTFRINDVVHRIAVLDVAEDAKKAKVRLVIETTTSTQSLLTVVNKVNFTK